MKATIKTAMLMLALSISAAQAAPSVKDMQTFATIMMMYDSNCEKLAAKYTETMRHIIDGMTEQEKSRVAMKISLAAMDLHDSQPFGPKFCEFVKPSADQYK